MRAIAMFAMFVGGLVLAGCGAGSSNAKDPTKLIAVDKTGGGHPGGVAPRPCDPTQGALLDAASSEGKRIEELCLMGASPEVNEEVRKTLSLGPGKTLTAEALRTDLAAAYKTAKLDQIEVRARQSGNGAVLFFALTERPLINAATTFEGTSALAGEDLLEKFPKAGSRLDRARLFGLSQKMTELYAFKGFDQAKVSPVVTPDGNGVKVKVVVVEGARAKIGKVTFEGAGGGRDVALRKAIELDAGTAFSNERLERAVLLVASFYFDRGFINVRVAEPKLTRASDGTTAIGIAITEGPVFRVGKLRVANVDAATEKDILANIKLKPGEVFNRSKLKADLEALEAAARKNGKTLSVEPQTTVDVKARTIDIVLDFKL